MIQIDDSGRVYCALTPERYHRCNPMDLYKTMSQCSDCPIIELGEEYVELKFDMEFTSQCIGRPLASLAPPPTDS